MNTSLKEAKRHYNAKYRELNKGVIKQYQAKYYELNREALLEYHANYREYNRQNKVFHCNLCK